MSTFTLAERTREPAHNRPAATPIGPSFDGVLVAAQAGAEWAWTLLYRAVAAPVRGYLIANGAEDPDNLLGELFLQLARNLPSFSGDEHAFRSWVFMVAHHRLVDERRRRRRRPAEPVGELPDRAGGEDPATAVLDAEALAALNRLTREQREVIALRVFGDLALEEVSRIVGRPVTAVKALQRRGLAALRKEFSDRAYPPERPRR
ncbi:MAG TPA: RNA polymerase sigma factor [Egibacteraceae bacterium]|nr:RNA polymerase sigma factor [Egibacteraceae bacterium]